MSELRSHPLMTVPFLPYSMEYLGALLDVLPVRNISWSRTPSRVTPLVPTTISGATLSVTTFNIIYLISCRICGIQYIGETKKSIKWFYGHISTIKTDKLDTPVGQHFNLPNHSISDMILQGIEALANRRESARLAKEKMWIRCVHTIHPHGLNIQEGNNFPFFSIFLSPQTFLHLFYICFTFVLHLFCLLVYCQFCFTPPV